MVRYIGLFLMLYFVTSCKYREHKATYSVVEIDTIDGRIERDLNEFNEVDTLDILEGSFIRNK